MDVCHNKQGISQVMSELIQRYPNKPISIIFGASSNKKVVNLMAAFETFSHSIESINCIQNKEMPVL